MLFVEWKPFSDLTNDALFDFCKRSFHGVTGKIVPIFTVPFGRSIDLSP